MFTLLTKLIPNKILAVYRTGSYLYGLSTDESDKDYIVIIDGFDGGNVIKEEGYDFFVFGRNYFEKLCNFDDKMMSYFAIWTDNTLLAKDNLEYIDNDYKDEFERLIKIDWNKHFYTWLKRVVDYFRLRLDGDQKSLYHLFRIKCQVDNFLKNGKFEYCFDEESKLRALEFKMNPVKHLHEAVEIFSYLESIVEEES